MEIDNKQFITVKRKKQAYVEKITEDIKTIIENIFQTSIDEIV